MTRSVDLRSYQTIRIELPASLKLLGVITGCLAELVQSVDGIEHSDALIYSVQLAAHEVCTNIVEHAYNGSGDGRILFVAGVEPTTNQLLIELRDHGASFNPEQIPDPSFDQPQDHGYGLFLIRELMDEVTYTPLSDGNHWFLRKQLG